MGGEKSRMSNDLPRPYQVMFDAMLAEGLSHEQAFRACCAIASELTPGGGEVYMAGKKTLLRCGRDEKIREQFNNYNTRQLALEFDLTETRIKQILSA